MRRLSSTCFAVLAGSAALAQTVPAPFNSDYTVELVGSPAGVPARLGGLTIDPTNSNVLLIASSVHFPAGAVRAVPLIRDAQGSIIGFAGPAVWRASAPRIDGGLIPGPGGVLFFGRYPDTPWARSDPGVRR